MGYRHATICRMANLSYDKLYAPSYFISYTTRQYVTIIISEIISNKLVQSVVRLMLYRVRDALVEYNLHQRIEVTVDDVGTYIK